MNRRQPGRRGWFVGVAALAASACLSATAVLDPPPAVAASSGRGSTPAAVEPNPFAGERPYIDPQSQAARAAATEPDPERARLLRKVASGGHAEWFGDWNPVDRVQHDVATRVRLIRSSGALPVVVVYNLPHRDCGGWSGGGASSAAEYRAWIDRVAAGIGTTKAVVVVEPDGLSGIDCLSPADQEVRYRLVSYAVRRLEGRPWVSTYIDAGHHGWHLSAVMAERLQRANVQGARGFALNVANFQTTNAEVPYGKLISDRIGGKTFVLDTSRNGLGPASGENRWCNPAGRALGVRPMRPAPDPRVDAVLWVKTPGLSDGPCDRGEPPAGTFWPDYAIGLANRATW